MTTWRRWLDWGTVVLGVLLFFSPFAFGATVDQGATWTAYVGGVLLALAGAWHLASPENRLGEWAAAALGVLLIISPWVVGSAGLVAMAWSAVVTGMLAVPLAASVPHAAGERPSRVAQAPQP